MNSKDLREKLRETVATLAEIESNSVKFSSLGRYLDLIHFSNTVQLLDTLDRYEDALNRIGKPCAYNDSPLNDCDCLSGNQCAEIAREALNDRGTDRV